MPAKLHVAMYHYIRNLPNTAFPNLKAMLEDDFHKQFRAVRERYEMATAESALKFLRGEYRPSRDMCLLTFDDGLYEHWQPVTHVLAEARVQGVFFPITSCMDGNTVAAVHMNHFLLARLGLRDYRERFLGRLRSSSVDFEIPRIDPSAAASAYRWDDPETAQFKYLFHFALDARRRDEIVREIFGEVFRDEPAFARDLYLTWDQAREMQQAGMAIGGHSHAHRSLASLSAAELEHDLATCHRLLRARLGPQDVWPFSYPFGKPGSYTTECARQLEALGFDCAFSTLPGANPALTDRFGIRRVDCKDLAA